MGMHSDDHILKTFLASNKPLANIAADLSLTLVALVRWMDRNVDLLAVAKRAMETHIAFLALKAEAAALVDLTNVSSSTTNEERKRKSASQLLRHSAKRVLSAGAPPTNPERVGGKLGAPCAPGAAADLRQPSTSSSLPNAESRMPNAGVASPSSLPPAPNSDLSLDELRARLAPHFGVDLTANNAAPTPTPTSKPTGEPVLKPKSSTLASPAPSA
jgi:hypothetical protein